jgi:hypothetical protein
MQAILKHVQTSHLTEKKIELQNYFANLDKYSHVLVVVLKKAIQARLGSPKR